MTTLDPVALAQAATAAAAGDGRPILEHALELAGAARQIGTLIDRLEGCVTFTATVETVDLEESSTRLLVSVRTRAGEDIEQLRTDRTDTAFGRIMADRARGLVGRRVLVHKFLEDAGADRKVRVLAWIEPLDGPGPVTAATTAPGPATLDRSSARDPGPPRRAERQPAPPPPDEPSAAEPADPAEPSGSAVDQVLTITDGAEIPRTHVDALIRVRYGAPALADLDPDHAAALADRLRNGDQLARFRKAAASDHAAEARA